MKKVLTILSIITLCIVLTTGCGKNVQSYTYKVDTNDTVIIELDIDSGYVLSKDVPFKVAMNGEEHSRGTFVSYSGIEDYIKSYNSNNYMLLDSGETNTIDYYMYNNTETNTYDYLIKVRDSNTGILLVNVISKEDSIEIFNLLNIKLKESNSK